VTNSNKNHSIG